MTLLLGALAAAEGPQSEVAAAFGAGVGLAGGRAGVGGRLALDLRMDWFLDLRGQLELWARMGAEPAFPLLARTLPRAPFPIIRR